MRALQKVWRKGTERYILVQKTSETHSFFLTHIFHVCSEDPASMAVFCAVLHQWTLSRNHSQKEEDDDPCELLPVCPAQASFCPSTADRRPESSLGN